MSKADVSGCNPGTDIGGALFTDTTAAGNKDSALFTGTSGTLSSSVGGNGVSVAGEGIDGLMYPLMPNGGSKLSNPSSFWGNRIGYPSANPNSTAQHDPINPLTVTVTLYRNDNTVYATLTTDAGGGWSVTNAAAALPLRAEYGNLPSGYTYTQKTDGATGPRHFITALGCSYDAGFYRTSEFCQNNPSLALACNFGSSAAGNTIQSLPYAAAEKLSDSNSDSVVNATDAAAASPVLTKLPSASSGLGTNAQTGPIWGLAYQKSNKQLYASAATVGSGGYATGQSRVILANPNGAGALYKIDTTSGSPSASLFYTITGQSAGSTYPTSIGTSGLGAIDFNEDNSVLYAVSLGSKAVISVNFSNVTNVTPTVIGQTSLSIPDPGCTANGSDTYRPFAVKSWRGDIYVGTSCTNQIKGFVQKYDGSSWSIVYTTSSIDIAKIGGQTIEGGIYTDLGYYAPFFITGLGFDSDGSILMGTSAGPGHTDFAQGRLYRVPKTASTWGTPTSFQPGSQDLYDNAGGLAVLPGSGQLVAAAQAPTTTLSNGLVWYNTSVGSADKKYSLYRTVASPYDGSLADSNAVGEISLLCDQAPLQINGRIWRDNNSNGRADASEPGIGSVTARLYTTGNSLVGTATTNAGGWWSFGGPANANLSGGQSITPNTTYRVAYDQTSDYQPSGPLENFTLTATNASGTTSNNNNDASIVVTYAEASITTGAAGASVLALDGGFIPPAGASPSPTPSSAASPSASPGATMLADAALGGLLPNTGSSQRLVLFITLILAIFILLTLSATEAHLRHHIRQPGFFNSLYSKRRKKS